MVRGRAEEREARKQRQCVRCRQPFTVPVASDPRRYCSVMCANQSTNDGKRKWYVCEQCGVHFNRRHAEAGRFCSRQCCFAWKAARREARAAAIEVRREERRHQTCAFCGQEFSGRYASRYCSRPCRNSGNLKEYHQNYVSKKGKVPSVQRCAFCGKEGFASINWTYCSRECAKAAGKDYRLRDLLVGGTGLAIKDLPTTYVDAAATLRKFNREAWRIYGEPSRG